MGLLNYTTARINELLAKVAALPAKVMDGDTKIPSKVSDLENDSKYVKETGLKTVNGHSLVGSGDIAISGGSGGGVADSVDWSNVLNKLSWVSSTTKPKYTASEVGALPSDTKIPSKASELENDSKFVKETGLKTVNGQSLIGTGNIVISGGSGGSGGGNVNVSNATDLKSGRMYVFTPASNGVSEGTFTWLPYASESAGGLMSASDYSKLKGFKEIVSLPVAVIGLTEDSSSEDIEAAFTLGGESAPVWGLAMMFSNLQLSEYEPDFADICIGNYKCFVDASYENTKCSLSLTYVVSGQLRTIKINGTANSDGVWTYSCEIQESGDDTYYLPSALTSLKAGATSDEIRTAAGGADGIEGIHDAIKAGKKIYTVGKSALDTYSIPVTAALISIIYPLLVFDATYDLFGKTVSKRISLTTSGASLEVIYRNGYALKKGVFSLTSESTSDDISTAVGGESGLKEIIKAAEDGNRFYITDLLDTGLKRIDLQVCGYKTDSSTGDMSINFYGKMAYLWGSTGGLLGIAYTKSTNTFQAQVADI